jgi:HPt (histidine-containing phosphotransfer) domain-containing protein
MDLTRPDPDGAKILIHPPQGLPRDVVAGFLSRCRASVGNLNASVERGEFEAARVFGHRLKGTGGGYGFPKLTEIGMAIERAAVAKQPGELRDLAAELATYLSQVEVAAG